MNHCPLKQTRPHRISKCIFRLSDFRLLNISIQYVLLVDSVVDSQGWMSCRPGFLSVYFRTFLFLHTVQFSSFIQCILVFSTIDTIFIVNSFHSILVFLKCDILPQNDVQCLQTLAERPEDATYLSEDRCPRARLDHSYHNCTA